MAVNIDDVAKAAGVSIATVSRVLSDKPYVSQSARARVLESVAELGYRPSRVAQSLRSQQTQIIGLIISDIQNPFFTAIVRAVEDYAHSHDYTLLLCNSDEDPEKETIYINLMLAENVAGVIISPTAGAEAACKQLLKNKIAVVSIDRRMATIDVDTVVTENVNATHKLISHLIENNHHRIGAITAPVAISTGYERQQGYRQALTDHHIELAPELVCAGIPKIETGYTLTNQLLALDDPPTALFTGNNLLTIGALRAIHEHNLSIPQDIAIVVYDEMDWMFVINPPLTVVAQPTYAIGQHAAELLLNRIANPTAPIRKIALEPQVHLRQSSLARQPIK